MLILVYESENMPLQYIYLFFIILASKFKILVDYAYETTNFNDYT